MTETFKFKRLVSCGESEYVCIRCGNILDERGENLYHPAELDEGLFGTKMVLIDCPFITITVKNPDVFTA